MCRPPTGRSGTRVEKKKEIPDASWRARTDVGVHGRSGPGIGASFAQLLTVLPGDIGVDCAHYCLQAPSREGPAILRVLLALRGSNCFPLVWFGLPLVCLIFFLKATTLPTRGVPLSFAPARRFHSGQASITCHPTN